jgi:molybdopterin-guanine dinucleotide biosynthesis protein A
MGSDKGLLQTNAVSWAQRAATLLSAHQLPVVFSVNAQQTISYTLHFPAVTLLPDNADLPVKGPLKGLLTIHRTYPQEDLFILACDMQDMQACVPSLLIEQYRQIPAEAFVYTHALHPEPLCGIYTAKGLRKIDALVQEQQLSRYSMQHILSLLNTHFTPIPATWHSFFTNYNSPATNIQ